MATQEGLAGGVDRLQVAANVGVEALGVGVPHVDDGPGQRDAAPRPGQREAAQGDAEPQRHARLPLCDVAAQEGGFVVEGAFVVRFRADADDAAGHR